MTGTEIEEYRQRLNDLTAKCSDEKPEPRIYKELKDLAREVGASTHIFFVGVSPKTKNAPTSELIRNIHQALQTASMANMCKTATQGYEIATEASKSAAEVSRRACTQFRITALVAFASMVAAWVAVIVTMVR